MVAMVSLTLFLLKKFAFELFNQLSNKCVKLRLTASKCSLVTNGLITSTQVGKHQL